MHETLKGLADHIIRELSSIQATFNRQHPDVQTHLENVHSESGLDLIALVVWIGDVRIADEVTVGWQAFTNSRECKMSLDAIKSAGEIILSADDKVVELPTSDAELDQLLKWSDLFFAQVRDNLQLIVAGAQ